jgi:hypothetical protein
MNDQTHDWLAEHMREDGRAWRAAWDAEHPAMESEEVAYRWWWVITGASVVVAAFVGFALCK